MRTCAKYKKLNENRDVRFMNQGLVNRITGEAHRRAPVLIAAVWVLLCL